MLFVQLILLATDVPPADHWRLRACVAPTQQILTCINSTHHSKRSCATGALADSPPTPCTDGFTCNPSTGTCAAAEIKPHLMRSVDWQLVEVVPSVEAAKCSDDPLEDARAGRMLCELLHAVEAAPPTFGHELGNTWLTAPASQRER